jgi:FixJ family two-component response regulator
MDERAKVSLMTKTLMISIVDDDTSVREATADLVHSLGYDANTFASAEQFLESGQIDDSSCVISDLQMPGMSGLELQECLRAQGHRVPIIFITAFPRANARQRAFDGGAVAFLTKPFEELSLIQALEAATKRILEPEPLHD